MQKTLTKIIGTVFGVGYLPYCPGTWASILTLWLTYQIFQTKHVVNLLFWLIFLTIIGIWSAGECERILKKKDASQIVIDEVLGQFISLLPIYFLAKEMLLWYVIGLALFRFFDIVKPLGIKQIQKLPGGYGVMADDILAGIYSALLIWGLKTWIVYII